MIALVLLMELKCIASKWKNSILLISFVTVILYNGMEVLLLAPLLFNKNIASVLWTIFCLRGQQRRRVVREELETVVDLFPYFGLNWALVFRGYGSVRCLLGELCIITRS